MTVKDDLHRLVDELPKKELHSAKRYLEYLRNLGDPVLRALIEAPEDDEEETEEERAAVAEAYKDLAAGKVFSLEAVKSEFNL
jgi:CO dehydrogenase/acetyl-CoA synthase beta subunit